ncbi:MAG: hypothetical protein ABI335_17350 [Polyangiaceae bacterium]
MIKRNPRDLLDAIVQHPPTNATRAEQLAFVQSLVDRDTCTPPNMRERGHVRPAPDTRPQRVKDLVRTWLAQSEIAQRSMARLDDPQLSAAERTRVMFHIREWQATTDELLALS